MLNSPNSATFSIVLDDDDAIELGAFLDLQEFFTGKASSFGGFYDSEEREVGGEGGWIRPKLIDFSPAKELGERWRGGVQPGEEVGDCWIRVHGSEGEVIGSYFAGSVTIEEWNDRADGVIDVTLSCWVSLLPEAGARRVWDEWSHRAPTHPGRWSSLPPDERGGWVEVARLYGGADRPRREGVRDYALDGSLVRDMASFYCALGELMNGPGGYYGGNLAAVDDCLLGGNGPAAPFRITWENSHVAMKHLGTLASYIEGRSCMDLIVECFERNGVVVDFA